MQASEIISFADLKVYIRKQAKYYAKYPYVVEKFMASLVYDVVAENENSKIAKINDIKITIKRSDSEETHTDMRLPKNGKYVIITENDDPDFIFINCYRDEEDVWNTFDVTDLYRFETDKDIKSYNSFKDVVHQIDNKSYEVCIGHFKSSKVICTDLRTHIKLVKALYSVDNCGVYPTIYTDGPYEDGEITLNYEWDRESNKRAYSNICRHICYHVYDHQEKNYH